MFTGCGTAMVTPFRGDGSLDEATLRKLVRRQIEQGIDFLVPCGTTGESPTLSRDEHLRVVAITVEESAQAQVRYAANSPKESARKVRVLAGAGGYNTREVIELARECQKLGADGILSVTPYYNKATQEGLYQHYKAIAAAIQIPIVLYSVQGRTGVNIEPSTVVRLAEIENIAGIKEASGNITQIAEVVHRVPEKFIVLSGDDAMTLPVTALGGRGVVSVASNQIPGVMSELTRLVNKNDFDGARKLQSIYFPLMQVNFIEANPIPVKWAMSVMGLLEPVYRLPMVEPSPASKQKIRQVLESVGLLAAARAH
jgi:4-hydroxy-tetrahydrodipicolinate synthase